MVFGRRYPILLLGGIVLGRPRPGLLLGDVILVGCYAGLVLSWPFRDDVVLTRPLRVDAVLARCRLDLSGMALCLVNVARPLRDLC